MARHAREEPDEIPIPPDMLDRILAAARSRDDKSTFNINVMRVGEGYQSYMPDSHSDVSEASSYDSHSGPFDGSDSPGLTVQQLEKNPRWKKGFLAAGSFMGVVAGVVAGVKIVVSTIAAPVVPVAPGASLPPSVCVPTTTPVPATPPGPPLAPRGSTPLPQAATQSPNKQLPGSDSSESGTGTPDSPTTPGVPTTPEAPKVPEIPTTPGVPTTPEIPEVPEITVEPEIFAPNSGSIDVVSFAGDILDSQLGINLS